MLKTRQGLLWPSKSSLGTHNDAFGPLEGLFCSNSAHWKTRIDGRPGNVATDGRTHPLIELRSQLKTQTVPTDPQTNRADINIRKITK